MFHLIPNAELCSKNECQKCMPIPPYGLEVCSISKRKLLSLDFTVNRVLMKLFRTSNTDCKDCKDVFGINLPSVQLIQRFDVFITNLE